MTEFFTRNAPDFGEEDSILGPPGTSIADKLRRMALLMSMQARTVWQDPGHALLPWTRAVGGVVKEIPAYISDFRNRDPSTPGDSYFSKTNPRQPTSDTSPAGQYVGPNDFVAHNTMPGYVPRQDWQNAVRQDPFADLLGPMQTPAANRPSAGL
jgi:hypothetical protein